MAKLKAYNREIEIKNGDKIDTVCEALGVPFGCHNGACGTCQIKIVKGMSNLSELTPEEETLGMDQNTRLACQCRIKSGKVEFEF